MKFCLLIYSQKIGAMIGPFVYWIIANIADILGIWRYPSNLYPKKYDLLPKIHPQRILKKAYRIYKLNRPIIEAEKGSNIKEYFEKYRRKTNISLLPEGFDCEMLSTISAVGDLLVAKGIENSVGKFYANIADHIFTDISIANLETTLTKKRSLYTGFQFCASPEQFNALKGHEGRQYTIFQTANNHILDHGIEGFNATHDQLDAEGFYYVGTNRSPEDQKKGLIITSNGIKFGFVAATYGVNMHQMISGKKDYLVNVNPFYHFYKMNNLRLLEEQISYCQFNSCDFIIVTLHWGMEFEFFPRQDQLNTAHHLIEYGADAIFSHHTHNIQPYEIYQTQRDPHRKAPIFYGLGNLSSLWYQPGFALSLIANFDVVKGHVNGSPKTLVERVNVTPVLQMEYDCKKIPYLQIEKLNDLSKTVHSRDRREYLSEAGQYADLVLGSSWRK